MNAGSAGNQFRYLPMMCERTPVSVALAQRLSAVAAELLGASVLPWPGEGDELPRLDEVASRHGFARAERRFCLLPRAAGRRARRAPRACPARIGRSSPRRLPPTRPMRAMFPGVAVPTAPGDALAFDEHLCHASPGGGLRRQWRVDFVAVTCRARVDALREHFARQYAPGWDGGYDVDCFPSYGDSCSDARPALERAARRVRRLSRRGGRRGRSPREAPIGRERERSWRTAPPAGCHGTAARLVVVAWRDDGPAAHGAVCALCAATTGCAATHLDVGHPASLVFERAAAVPEFTLTSQNGAPQFPCTRRWRRALSFSSSTAGTRVRGVAGNSARTRRAGVRRVHCEGGDSPRDQRRRTR